MQADIAPPQLEAPAVWLGATAVAIRALTDIRALAVVALLLVNDHVLKELWPGVVTGKLSDFAGLAFFPLLLAAAVGPFVKRPQLAIRVSVFATAVWFIAMKTTAWAAELTEGAVASIMGSSAIVVDPTDLIALPALFVAYSVLCDAEAGRSRWLLASRSGWSPQARRVLRVIAILVAGFASLATSCNSSDGMTDVAVHDGSIYAFGRYAYYTAFAGHVSSDGGATWTESPQPLPDAVFEDPTTMEDCLPGDPDHCFRISGDPYVLESFDGGASWQIAWELPPGRQEYLERNGDSCDPYTIRSWDLQITDESIVLVAMGDDGLFRRNADGTWDRDILGQAAPLADPGQLIWNETLQAFGYLLLALLLVVLLARQLLAPDPSSAGWWTLLAVLAFVVFAVALSLVNFNAIAILLFVWAAAAYLMWAAPGPFGGWSKLGLAMLLAAGVAIVVAGLLPDGTESDLALFAIPAMVFVLPGFAGLLSAWPRLHEINRRGTLQLGLIGNLGAVVTAGLFYWPFYAWSAGSIDLLSDATSIAGVVAIVSVILIGVAMYAVSRLSPTLKQPQDEVEVPGPEERRAEAVDAEEEAAAEAEPPGRSPWLAALALGVGAVLGWFYLPVAVGSYLAARWTGHKSPAARTLVALTVGMVLLFATSGFGGIATAIWGVSVVSLRAPDRFAWVPRTALLAVLLVVGVTLRAPQLGVPISAGSLHLDELIAFAVPFAVVASDLWAGRYAESRRNRSAVEGD